MGKIIGVEDVISYGRLDRDEVDDEISTVNTIIEATELYLYGATGRVFTRENPLAVLFCKVLFNDWYENREYMASKEYSDKVRYTIQSLLLQLQYSADEG